MIPSVRDPPAIKELGIGGVAMKAMAGRDGSAPLFGLIAHGMCAHSIAPSHILWVCTTPWPWVHLSGAGFREQTKMASPCSLGKWLLRCPNRWLGSGLPAPYTTAKRDGEHLGSLNVQKKGIAFSVHIRSSGRAIGRHQVKLVYRRDIPHRFTVEKSTRSPSSSWQTS